MNPTTDHVLVPEGPITRSKVKKIQEAYRFAFGVELPIKEIINALFDSFYI